MAVSRAILLALALFGSGDCAPLGTVSRAPGPAIPAYSGAGPEAPAPGARQAAVRTTELRVIVPEELSVSEADAFFPRADIVWQAEEPGDRRAQVAAILREAAGRAVADRGTGRPAILEITLSRFHALSERARVTVGGTHDIRFRMRLLDAGDGREIAPAQAVHEEFDAYGGLKALVALRAGRTQRVRIVEQVADALSRRLGSAAQVTAAAAGAADGPG